MEKLLRLSPIRISILYGIVATGWVLFSDSLLFRSNLSPTSTLHFAMLKGTLFVVATMFALCCLMRTMTHQIEKTRTEHETELRESEARFSTAFRSSPEGMSISSIEEGQFLEANSVLLSMLGYSRTELIGRSSVELSVWVDAADRVELLKQLSRGPVNRYSTRLRRKDGSPLDVEASVEEIQLHGKSHLLAIIRDVTKQLELERQFQQAQKLEAMAQVSAGVAHDFKNQLMVIGACTDMLEVTDEKSVGLKNQITAAVKKSTTLARQLMAFSRRQKLAPEVLDLGSVLPELWKMISRCTGTGIKSALVISPETWRVYADRSQFEQIMLNLAVNACDAMPSSGEFTVSVSNLKLSTDTAISNELRIPGGDYVRLRVSDTGHGISAENITKIFQPFFTTKEQGKGTGLGLAAVYSIVNQSRGFIYVESALGSGTSFYILLPRHIEIPQSLLVEPRPQKRTSRTTWS
jgi:PAS domain S-box-containing protein